MKTIIILVILIISEFCFSLDTTSQKYFPLNVGNVFVYRRSPSQIIYIRAKITKDTVLNSHRYYFFDNYPTYMGAGWYRVDSNSGSLMKQSQACQLYNNETIIDSLSVNSIGLLNNICYNSSLSDTNIMNIFGYSRKSKYFFSAGYNSAIGKRYVRDFGIIYIIDYYYQPYGFWEYHLMGAVINGIVYGDTSVPVGIKQISAIEPSEFSLYQNFPNPFNPSTKIRFSTPLKPPFIKGGTVRSTVGLITLKVYDILGREVATLVNEQLKPGTYEVEFPPASENGRNYPSGYASGVYFYTLTADNFKETKKMVFVK